MKAFPLEEWKQHALVELGGIFANILEFERPADIVNRLERLAGELEFYPPGAFISPAIHSFERLPRHHKELTLALINLVQHGKIPIEALIKIMRQPDPETGEVAPPADFPADDPADPADRDVSNLIEFFMFPNSATVGTAASEPRPTEDWAKDEALEPLNLRYTETPEEYPPD
jgi:hypothetical protein